MIYEEFLKRARDKHGDTYDYPRWEGNINVHSKVPVICKEHGDFEQTINNHTRGSKGCRTCGVVKRANSKRTTYEHFVVMARKKHGDRYTYPKWSAPKTQKDKVVVWCPDHGEFTQNIDSHIRACGCPSCGRESSGANRRLGTKKFLEKARAVHGTKYSYQGYVGVLSKEKITIHCPVHGEFEQWGQSHLAGQGCPKCGIESSAKSRVCTVDEFISRSQNKHGTGTYGYSKVSFKTLSEKVTIKCRVHGDFKQSAINHINGAGCFKCGVAARSAKGTKDRSFIINKLNQHPDSETLSYIKRDGVTLYVKCSVLDSDGEEHGVFTPLYGNLMSKQRPCPKCSRERQTANSLLPEETIRLRIAEHPKNTDNAWDFVKREGKIVTILCNKKLKDGRYHGEFPMWTNTLVSKAGGCPRCSPGVSDSEESLRAYVQSLGLDCIKARGGTLPGLGKFEIDMLIPEIKIGVEYNGLAWHSERFKENAKKCHLNKTELVESLDHRLIQIFEDEWLEKEELVKARLRAILVPPGRRFYGRKTEVVTPTWKEAQEFLNISHLQGPGTGPSHIVGLSFDGELLSVATFSKSRFSNKYDWELVRFASKPDTCVVGGLSKLIKEFARRVRGGVLISYADRRWSQGDAYLKSGFVFAGNTEPNYFYTDNRGERFSRQKFQKHKLPKILDKFDLSLTEAENCNANGFYRIWDCGSSRWTIDLGSLV